MQFAVAAAASLVLVPAARGESSEPCPDADLRPTSSNLPRVEAAMLCLLNVEREREGRVAITRDKRLDRSARYHNHDMTTHDYFGHWRRGEPVLFTRIKRAAYFKGTYSGLYGENLGYGPPERATGAAMNSAFMSSESHRETMLYGRFRNVGIASEMIGPNPGFYPDHPAVVFTVDFGRRYERRRVRCARARSAADGVRPRRWCRHRRRA